MVEGEGGGRLVPDLVVVVMVVEGRLCGGAMSVVEVIVVVVEHVFLVE